MLTDANRVAKSERNRIAGRGIVTGRLRVANSSSSPTLLRRFLRPRDAITANTGQTVSDA